MPAMMLLHYTRPELGVIVPWWSVLLLPMATTASVLVHTPRSLKYATTATAATVTTLCARVVSCRRAVSMFPPCPCTITVGLQVPYPYPYA